LRLPAPGTISKAARLTGFLIITLAVFIIVVIVAAGAILLGATVGALSHLKPKGGLK
jgi:hypothetical protein